MPFNCTLDVIAKSETKFDFPQCSPNTMDHFAHHVKIISLDLISRISVIAQYHIAHSARCTLPRCLFY